MQAPILVVLGAAARTQSVSFSASLAWAFEALLCFRARSISFWIEGPSWSKPWKLCPID